MSKPKPSLPLKQFCGQLAPIDRAHHVWYHRPATGDYKCVICGGVARIATLDDLPDWWESLSDAERSMCPPKWREEGR